MRRPPCCPAPRAAAATALTLPVLAALLCALPRRPSDVDAPLLRAYDRARASASAVSVVSFNIRIDAEERDERNHFRHRVHRLSALLRRLDPWLVGVQEPSSGQLLHLQSLLPPQWRAVGYAGGGHGAMDRAHPARADDFQTGILYDDARLELVDEDHVWLSPTPRTRGSKVPGSLGVRTLTAAAFRTRGGGGGGGDDGGADVVLLNTHLDVASEPARRRQAGLALAHARRWRGRHPRAAVFLTGDFNSANTQAPHRALVGDGVAAAAGPPSPTTRSTVLADAWDACVAAGGGCASHDFAATFHGWLGSAVNTYAARAAQAVVLAAHGSGVRVPLHPPATLREALRDALSVLRQVDVRAVWGAVPSSWRRMHVDWVLYGGARAARPTAVFVGDIRDANFSSDHFPVVSVFELDPA